MSIRRILKCIRWNLRSSECAPIKRGSTGLANKWVLAIPRTWKMKITRPLRLCQEEDSPTHLILPWSKERGIWQVCLFLLLVRHKSLCTLFTNIFKTSLNQLKMLRWWHARRSYSRNRKSLQRDNCSYISNRCTRLMDFLAHSAVTRTTCDDSFSSYNFNNILPLCYSKMLDIEMLSRKTYK